MGGTWSSSCVKFSLRRVVAFSGLDQVLNAAQHRRFLETEIGDKRALCGKACFGDVAAPKLRSMAFHACRECVMIAARPEKHAPVSSDIYVMHRACRHFRDGECFQRARLDRRQIQSVSGATAIETGEADPKTAEPSRPPKISKSSPQWPCTLSRAEDDSLPHWWCHAPHLCHVLRR
jgi:hypothetical protein